MCVRPAPNGVLFNWLCDVKKRTWGPNFVARSAHKGSRIAHHSRTSNERSPRKYSADPLRACNTYNNGHPLVALFFGDDEILREFPDIKDQALSKRLSKKFVGVVFTLEVALTNIAKIAIYRQTYNFSCSEMKSQKTAAFYMVETGKIVGIVLGNHRKSMKNFRKQN